METILRGYWLHSIYRGAAKLRKEMTQYRFNGPEYKTEADHSRLSNQHDRIKSCMADQKWRTIREISVETGDPEASVSAQLRHLRKPRFGSFIVERRPRNDRSIGLFEYRVLKSQD